MSLLVLELCGKPNKSCRFVEVILSGAVPSAQADESRSVAFPPGAEGKGHGFRGKHEDVGVVWSCREYGHGYRYERELRSLPLVNLLTLSCVGKPGQPARGSGSRAVRRERPSWLCARSERSPHSIWALATVCGGGSCASRYLGA